MKILVKDVMEKRQAKNREKKGLVPKTVAN